MTSRELEGETLTLSASGWTYDDTFVLYDRETFSLWYHLPGKDGLTCVSGPLADKELKKFPSVFGRWNKWLKRYPNTKYLRYP